MFSHIKCPCKQLADLQAENAKLKRELSITRRFIYFNDLQYALNGYFKSVEGKEKNESDCSID